MSSGTTLTATSYAILGLLAVKPWSTYELTRQMDRSLGRFWPRAASKLYEEPKKLVAEGLARASSELVGRRSRTVYDITPDGRSALAAWLEQPGAGPVLECEQLVKVFFSENSRREDLLGTLRAAREWGIDRARESVAVGEEYLAGRGPFPERSAQQLLTAGFLNRFYEMVLAWADWAEGVVAGWPDELRDARGDPEAMALIVADITAALDAASAGSGSTDRSA